MAPKFKGLLSIGVDEVSNSLMVSAPGYLFDHVTKMIKDLDEAAVPDYTVKMVHVTRGVSPQRMKEILDEIYLQSRARSRRWTRGPRRSRLGL